MPGGKRISANAPDVSGQCFDGSDGGIVALSLLGNLERETQISSFSVLLVCDSLKLCKIRAAYYVENGEVQLNADDILKCYDTFEWLVERLFDTMQSVFYRVSQIDDALRISVHIVAEADLRGLMSERPELNVQQEDENEWFIGCIVFRKRGGR